MRTRSYDALNRKTVQTHYPDGSTLQWCYDGVSSTGSAICLPDKSSYTSASWTDTVDETGRHWQHVSDALGRLIAVMEPGPTVNAPTLQTVYFYDALSNLTVSNQFGAAGETIHARSFTYDSLSRLLCASNPENSSNSCPSSSSMPLPGGVVSYAYDSNGNLAKRTDARGAWAQFGYDGLNRLLTKSYSDTGTLPVTIGYDASSAPLSAGRMTSESVMSGPTVVAQRAPVAYDAMGHVTQMTECTPANCATTPYQLAYVYDLASNEIGSTNGIPSATFNGVGVPSISFAMGYDPAGRLSSASSSWSDALSHPATLFQANSTSGYTPLGQLQNATLGINAQTSSSAASIARNYDPRLRVLSETDTASAVVTRPATSSSASVTISGSEQQALAPTSSTGAITIAGTDGTYQHCRYLIDGTPICTTVPDAGSMTAVVNGFSAAASYTGSDTNLTVAASLATALNASGSPVRASASNGVVTMTSVATGAGVNYAYSVSSHDFSPRVAGPNMTGGTAGRAGDDTGTVSVTINGMGASASWGTGSTPQSLAAALATSIRQVDGANFTASVTGSTVQIASVQTGAATNVSLACGATGTNSQYATASFSSSCTSLAGGTDAGTQAEAIYSFAIPASGGYAANGNLLSVADSVTGNWSYGYDYLNRLTSATGNSGLYNGGVNVAGISLGWSYDSFGNRLTQTSNSGNMPSAWAHYSPANNRLSSSNTAVGGVVYDNAGDVTSDGINQYAYDAEGHVCAVWNGLSSYTGYIYDAEGERVAKGTINGLNCNLATNGFTLTSSYVRGSKGELLTEMKANGVWDHSNVYGPEGLLATYHDPNTYFSFNDWLGTKRAELSAAGCLQTFASMPFGDNLTSQGNCPDAAEQHFTGKERDAESGLDYFGARYYASTMGRWMSPDWADKPEAVPYSSLDNPQSLNLYQYVNNNPLSHIDKDGHCYPFCTVAIGAVVGAGAGALAEYAGEKLKGEPVNGTKILHAAEGGAVAGAITGLVGPEAGLAVKVGVSVVGQVAGGGTERALNGEKVVNGKEIAKDAVAGAVGAKVEGAAETTFAATALKKVVPAVIETSVDSARRGSGGEQPKPPPPPQPQPKQQQQ